MLKSQGKTSLTGEKSQRFNCFRLVIRKMRSLSITGDHVF